MQKLNGTSYAKTVRPIKILQFGEGNFLRAFADWIIQKLNDGKVINADVCVVQPVEAGRVAELAKQDGLYTVCLEGVDKGERVQTREIIDVLADFVNPYTDYAKFLQYAHSEELEVIISNTTEAGIALDSTDTDFSVCPRSFPGKLLAFLYERYNFFGADAKGLAIVPCELIDNNGATLKRVLVQLAQIRNMGEDFIRWLTTANHFTDTLVDRIVPGYPRDTVESVWRQTGYEDNNVVKAEVFHLWVLKQEPFVESKFPADKCALNVIFAPDITPYKQRKVKILNGAHTAMVPIAYLCGLDTVGEAMEDADVRAFVEQLIFDEIKPTIALPQDETDRFAFSVLERFQNPFIRHELMSIALNSTSKFCSRLLPTYNDYKRLFGRSPKHIMFAFASLVAFFRGKRGSEPIALQDEARHLEFWKELWNGVYDFEELAREALSYINGGLATVQNITLVSQYLEDIESLGMRNALQKFLDVQLAD